MLFQPNPDGPHVVNEAGAEPEEPKLRRHFVGRVFGLVALQLFVTGLLITFGLYNEQVREQAEDFSELGCALFSLIPFIVILASQRGKRGCCGIVCLIAVIWLLAAMMMLCSLRPSENTVLMAACVTAVITLTIICFSACVKAFDVTKYYAVMIVVTFFGILCYLLLLLLDHVSSDSNLAQVIIASIGSLTFSVLLLYLTQTILGGRKIVIRPDEMIFAQARLYVNIVFIYRFLLVFEF